MKTEDLYNAGMKTRRSVLGNEYVDKAEANKTEFDKDFQEFITNNAWGSVWSRPGLTKRERSLITIAILTALGHEEELALHLRATKNTGASAEDIKEVEVTVEKAHGFTRDVVRQSEIATEAAKAKVVDTVRKAELHAERGECQTRSLMAAGYADLNSIFYFYWRSSFV